MLYIKISAELSKILDLWFYAILTNKEINARSLSTFVDYAGKLDKLNFVTFIAAFERFESLCKLGEVNIQDLRAFLEGVTRSSMIKNETVIRKRLRYEG